MLAGRLDHEPPEEAGGRAVREREAGEQPEQRRVARREAEAVGDRRPGVDAPDRPAVDEHRDEDQGLLLGRVVDPAADRARCQDSSERTNSSSEALAPCSSGCSPHTSSPSTTALPERVQPPIG